MKAPENASLIIRCASGKGCTLCYVEDEAAYVSEWRTRLDLDHGQPVAHHGRLRQDTGLATFRLPEEIADPTSVVASCRCANWEMNMGSVARMVQDGGRGEVIHDGRKLPDFNTVVKTTTD